MLQRHLKKLLSGGARFFNCKKIEGGGAVHWSFRLCHYSGECTDEVLPFEWYKKAFPTITKLTQQLQDVDLIDGRLINMIDGLIIIDDNVEKKMRTLKSLVRVFVGSPLVQQKLRTKVMEALPNDAKCNQVAFFPTPSERESMVVNSLVQVNNCINVSVQQRKLIRSTISPQVTQHRIWKATLEKILGELKLEMNCLNCQFPGKGSNMGQQIVYSCSKFLANMDNSYIDDSTSWMRLGPTKNVNDGSSSKWEDVFEMFNDLIKCLQSEKRLLYHVSKLEVMKEGLAQIKDILTDKSIGYREIRHQENLVQKKLSKTLGHSSRCLFTLLLYYLYGHVRDIEVDMRGGIYDRDGNGTSFVLCMGRILTADEDEMVQSGVKQLDRALGLFKFVWEIAGMKGTLEMQGHLWCVGARDRTLTYKGNLFFVHEICL